MVDTGFTKTHHTVYQVFRVRAWHAFAFVEKQYPFSILCRTLWQEVSRSVSSEQLFSLYVYYIPRATVS